MISLSRVRSRKSLDALYAIYRLIIAGNVLRTALPLVSRGISLRAEPQVFWHRDCGLLGRAVDKRKEEHGMFKRSLIQLLILGFIVSLLTGWGVYAHKESA